MRILPRIKSAYVLNFDVRTSVGLTLLATLTLSAPLHAEEFSVSGESTTILRMRTTTDDKELYPVYEYLKAGTSGKLPDGSTLSLYMGGWGRLDLFDRTTDRVHSDTDLQYFFLSYRPAKNSTSVNLGRQFVTEGVAAEKIDGIYARSDFDHGISAAAFIGQPVTTDLSTNTNGQGADLVYGGRISHSMPKLYTIGLSGLKSEADHDSKYREEVGIDLWAHPLQKVDLTGRSSYNSITSGWMEHAYTLSLSPMKDLKVSTSVTNLNYTDYFHNMTTPALSLTNGILTPGEAYIALGAAASYTFLKEYTVTADYKNYSYDIAGDAKYYGIKLGYSAPKVITAGIAYHRMDGENFKLRYDEYRLYALKKFGHLDLSADLMNIHYDKGTNNVSSSYTMTGSAGYELNEQMKIGADLEYSRNPDFDNDLRALVKLTLLFDTQNTDKGGKSEK